MNVTTTNNWHEANQRYLTTALAMLRETLQRHAARADMNADEFSAGEQALQQATERLSAPSALDTLGELFGLSIFERATLLLCAGTELDSAFPTLCAAAQGDPAKTYPTFSLALAALPHPHWSALTPAASLRRWRLIEIGTGSALTLSPLKIDERVLHYLTGVNQLDERLVGLVEPVPVVDDLVSSQRVLAERMAATWSYAQVSSAMPVLQLCGDEIAGKRAIAAAACDMLGWNLGVTSAHALPANPAELEAMIRLWERESVLSECALLLDCDETVHLDAGRESVIIRMMERIRCPLIVTSRERRRSRHRPLITFEVRKPAISEQQQIWQDALGETTLSLNGHLETLAGQFNLSAPAIHAVCAEALGRVRGEERGGAGEEREAQDENSDLRSTILNSQLSTVLWEACRMQARPRLDDLAQRIESANRWDDLVLPELQKQILRQMAVHLRQRMKVYQDWGFAGKSSRGLGISALFTGVSGTGKTMAAEVLANELRLDLYRIDLSQVVSKYIGETEKNLRRVFEAAEEGGGILLFDEADALFGKRSEVKDSHDRYANIEISYLLQRMEAYRGLAILTTNMKDALDQAFLRRIRFVVQFPFPDAAQRTEIWRRIFPASTPTESLDFNKLARLNVPGGNIRNIALNSAFLAADTREPVRMKHLLRAARSEYAKLERPLTEAEIGGWG